MNNTLVVDLHGYPVWQALEVAEAAILDANQQPGVNSITLIHGAPDIRHHAVAQALRRGGIKWSLRGCLARGEWDKWVYPRWSKRHRIGDGSMTLALRKKTTL